MAKYLTDELELQSVADAIRAKGGTSESLAFPAGFVSAIEDIPTGGGSSVASAKDVNFRDYDGTITNSYTKEEFANLTEMPANPSQEGLTAQGWNWSLAKAKAYVAKYGKLEIGQIYTTDDGKTRIYIHLEKGRTSPMLGVCPNGTVDVDWGDGTTHDTLTGTSLTTAKWTPNHNYAAPGDYVIKLTITGSMGFYGSSLSNQYAGLLRFSSSSDTRNRIYQNAIQRVKISSDVTYIGTYAFYFCQNLTSINIPNGVTSIGNYAFYCCYKLASINIPNSVTSIGDFAFSDCDSLAFANIPDSVTNIGKSAFKNCYSLTSINIPERVTSIGDNTFNSCYNLASANIPDNVASIGEYVFSGCQNLTSINISNGVTNIGNHAFYCCYKLASINIPNSVTSLGPYIFENCYRLTSISIPNGVTSINSSAFASCRNLNSINISDSVTNIEASAFNSCYNLAFINIPNSITSIKSYTFSNCYNLASLNIPNGVTSIGNYAFQGCSGISEYHFASTTPPTLSSTSIFNGIAADCIIYVPVGSLEAYQTATNWSTYADKMQEEPV